MIKPFNKVVRFLLVLSLGYPYLFGHDLVNNIAGLSVHYNKTRFGFVALIRVLWGRFKIFHRDNKVNLLKIVRELYLVYKFSMATNNRERAFLVIEKLSLIL
jgi:hypothetical protein